MCSDVLAICSRNMPGCVTFQKHLCNVIGARHVDLEELKPNTLKEYEAIILGAFHPQYLQLLHQIPKETKVILIFHSPLLQQELSPQSIELYLLRIVLELERLDHIWILDYDLYEVLKDKYPKTFWTPHPISIEHVKVNGKIKKTKDVILMALDAPRKSIATQLAACKLAGVRVHTTGLSQVYRQFAEIIGVEHQPHSFLPQGEYFNLVASMLASLNCFLSESFAYSALESLALGVPPIVSPTIGENLKLNGVLAEHLIVENIDSPLAIAQKMKQLFNTNWTFFCKAHGEQLAKENNAVLKAQLKAILSEY